MKQLLIMVMAMAFCTATAEAQTTLQRNDSLYFTREQIKFERVNANGVAKAYVVDISFKQNS